MHELLEPLHFGTTKEDRDAKNYEQEFLLLHFTVFYPVVVIVIHNSDLLAGALDKSVIGSGSKASVFYVLLRDFGPQVSDRRNHWQSLRIICRSTSCFSESQSDHF